MDCVVEQKPLLSAIGRVVDSVGEDSETTTVCQIVNVCRQCLTPILDAYMLKVNESTFHENCLRCCSCEKNLENKCYEKDGRFYCETHYYHDHSPFKCASCNVGISPTNFVYKLRTNLMFHLLCHICCICGKQLLPGEQITVDQENRTVSCAGHLTEASGSSMESHVIPSDDSGLSEVQLMTSSFPCDTDYSQLTQFTYDGFAYDFMDENKLLKRRGPRTTIKQDQLDVLNQIFTSTPKPSKHARAKLALETGLSMRVIQVWFQNRRSKERRLKHLCNYLRRYEQRGLVAPSIGIAHNGRLMTMDPVAATVTSSTVTIERLFGFPFDTGLKANDAS